MVYFARRFPNDERVRDAFVLVLDILKVRELLVVIRVILSWLLVDLDLCPLGA